MGLVPSMYTNSTVPFVFQALGNVQRSRDELGLLQKGCTQPGVGAIRKVSQWYSTAGGDRYAQVPWELEELRTCCKR